MLQKCRKTSAQSSERTSSVNQHIVESQVPSSPRFRAQPWNGGLFKGKRPAWFFLLPLLLACGIAVLVTGWDDLINLLYGQAVAVASACQPVLLPSVLSRPATHMTRLPIRPDLKEIVRFRVRVLPSRAA